MSSVLRKMVSDVRRHKLQTAIVSFVVFLSALTGTLALTLLVETDAPYDHAFAQVNGAHLLVWFESSAVSEQQVAATRSLPPVAQAGGPWRVVPASITIAGGRVRDIPVEGRDQAGGAIDRLTIDGGRWVQSNGEVVLSRELADETGLGVGYTLSPASNSVFPSLRVVGIAVSMGDEAAAWVEPGQLPTASGATAPPSEYLMAYRLHNASTPAEIASAVNTITASVRPDAVSGTSNYLDAKLSADRTTAVMIPFLLAFSVFALVASALIIANLVGGAVITGTREIGIMKSVGFTPAQVVATFAGRMTLPAVAGCVAGLPAGVALSQPFLDKTAHAFGLPRTFGFAPGVDALGVGAILLTVAGAALLASLRAGRQSAAAAIAAGTSPAGDGGSLQARLTGAIPLPRPATLGLGESLDRPVRSAMTIAAIVIGVATATFAVGLHLTLSEVASALTRSQQVQVEVDRAGNKDNAGGLGDDQTAALIATQRGTARFVSIAHTDVSVSGAGETVPVTAYRGDSSWIGYVLIHGRWFSAPGEAVAPTAFFTRTGHHIGDAVSASFFGTPVQFTLVGEIFDQQGDDILLRTGFDSLPARLVAGSYEVQLKPGTDALAWASSVAPPGSGLSARLNNQENGIDTAFLLINSVLAGLAVVLGLIAVSGVFNTVVLNIREKARDFAILKAVGMTPRQVVTMVLASVSVLGLLGAFVGIPSGIALHRYILTVMGQIATSTGVPDLFFHVFSPTLLAVLALAGLVIAMLGATLPAQWAARSRITEVLQAE